MVKTAKEISTGNCLSLKLQAVLTHPKHIWVIGFTGTGVGLKNTKRYFFGSLS
jgi:hypothetical protein